MQGDPGPFPPPTCPTCWRTSLVSKERRSRRGTSEFRTWDEHENPAPELYDAVTRPRVQRESAGAHQESRESKHHAARQRKLEMTLYRKRLTSCLFAMLALLAQAAVAQTYPSKPVRFVVGFAPGGPNDILARIVGQKLSEGLGVPVPVDNRPGADSMIGTEMVSRATPDGHTIGMISASATIHPSVYTKVPYDVAKDFSH